MALEEPKATTDRNEKYKQASVEVAQHERDLIELGSERKDTPEGRRFFETRTRRIKQRLETILGTLLYELTIPKDTPLRTVFGTEASPTTYEEVLGSMGTEEEKNIFTLAQKVKHMIEKKYHR